MTTLYVAGPMRGLRYFNFETFLDVARQLREHGYEVICPAERDIENGFNPIEQGLTGNEDLSSLGFDLGKTLAWDLEQVCTKADGVAVLTGWHRSKGATAEVAAAEAVGKESLLWHRWIDRAIQEARR